MSFALWKLLKMIPLSWILLAALIAAGGAYHLITVKDSYEQGWRDAMSTVAAQNQEAAISAARAQMSVNLCHDMEGHWDVISASCRLPD
jgi:hypothetical protein